MFYLFARLETWFKSTRCNQPRANMTCFTRSNMTRYFMDMCLNVIHPNRTKYKLDPIMTRLSWPDSYHPFTTPTDTLTIRQLNISISCFSELKSNFNYLISFWQMQLSVIVDYKVFCSIFFHSKREHPKYPFIMKVKDYQRNLLNTTQDVYFN